MYPSTWHLDSTKILTRRELAAVLADAKSKRSLNAQRNLIIFRLACCCGLRVSEVPELQVGDVFLDVERPHRRLRPRGDERRKGEVRTVVVGFGDVGGPTGLEGATERGIGGPICLFDAGTPGRRTASTTCDSAPVSVGLQSSRC